MRSSVMLIVVVALFLVGFNDHKTVSSQTLAPTQTPVCNQAGTSKQDKIDFPDLGETHKFWIYLPPCYAEDSSTAYPVLYWAAVGGNDIFDVAESLIHKGETPAFILVMLEIDVTKGFGADERIVNIVVPYIDSHYRTLPDRLHRSITGISHGAAIAVRSAFRPPYTFGRVAVISGGIADGEQEKFTNWIKAMKPDEKPIVLIDVGDQDGIVVLTNHLRDLLDKLKFPYTFTHAPGGHETAYWGQHIVEYLKWLVPLETQP